MESNKKLKQTEKKQRTNRWLAEAENGGGGEMGERAQRVKKKSIEEKNMTMAKRNSEQVDPIKMIVIW